MIPSGRRTLVRGVLTLTAVTLVGCGAPEDADREPAATAVEESDTATSEAASYVSYAVVSGADTLSVQRILRSSGRLATEVSEGSAEGGRTLIYEATTGADGLVRSVTLEPRAAGAGSRTSRRTTFHFGAGRVIREAAAGDSIRADTLVVAEGALPWFENSAGFLEQLLHRARSLEADTVTIPLLDLTGGEAASEASVAWDGEGFASVRIDGGEPIRATLDEDGRLTRAEHAGSAVTIVRRR